MPSGATDGARDSLREPRVPHDAAALVAAAARLRGARSDAEAARVGTAEILALLRAPRDADAPSPRRLRARCGWALDHGVVDALVEAMRTHADCVSLQGLAVTCLAEIAEAFVGDADAPRVITAEQKTPSRREDDVYVFEKKLCVPRRVPACHWSPAAPNPLKQVCSAVSSLATQSPADADNYQSTTWFMRSMLSSEGMCVEAPPTPPPESLTPSTPTPSSSLR